MEDIETSKILTKVDTEKYRRYLGPDRVVEYQEVLEDLRKERELYRVPTGFKQLDDVINGFEAGELIVISGPTGGGKTTLAMTLTQHIAPIMATAWFTLEVTYRQFAEKVGEHAPMFYLPKRNEKKTVEWIIHKIIEARVKYGVRVVFIDHIGMLESAEHFRGEHRLELKWIVSKLKEMAVDMDMVIVLLAHITEDLQSAQEPHHSQIRDSRDIAHLCDTFIGIWRLGASDDGNGRYRLFGAKGSQTELDSVWSKIKVTKNRRTGKLGWFTVKHDGRFLVPTDETQRTHPVMGTKYAHEESDEDLFG